MTDHGLIYCVSSWRGNTISIRLLIRTYVNSLNNSIVLTTVLSSILYFKVPSLKVIECLYSKVDASLNKPQATLRG